MATLQHRSAFNLRGCQPIGGQALEPVKSQCDESVLENIYEQVKQAASDYKWESERTLLRTKLTYNCPKVGDAVRWDPKIKGFNLSYAMFDTNNPEDQEHLTEVIGIVESVSVTCDGSGSEQTEDGIETNAVVVLSGKISFDTIPTESNLEAGKVYYLWDRTHPSQVKLGNNVTSDIHEPVISKPLFVATGTNTAVVLNYRPLTGSPTGGRPQSERYDIKVEKTALGGGGWKVTIENIGGITSRHPIIAQIDYTRRTGPQESLNGGEVHTMFKNIGILSNKFVADVTQSDTLEYKTEFLVTVESEFGIKGGVSDNLDSGINGVGDLTVTLKSNTANSQSASILKSLIPFQTANTLSRFPNIRIKGECGYASQDDGSGSDNLTTVTNNDLDIPDKVVSPGGASTAYSFEGVIFEISLEKDPLNEDIRVPMAEELYFKVESASLPEPIINKFFLDSNQTAVEIIPVNEQGEGITQENVTLSILNKDGTPLDIRHWAQIIQPSTFICDSERCCSDDKILIDVMEGGSTPAQAKLADLLSSDGDSKFMTTGQNDKVLETNPKLYTLKEDFEIAMPGGASENALRVTYKNARERTHFCYPKNVEYGTQPSFMALYFNEARQDVLGIRGAKDYDPRYIAIEIGGQDTLDNEVVTITLNVGKENECCIDFKFDGSVEGKHYTFRELYEAGLIIKRSTNSDLLLGIEKTD